MFSRRVFCLVFSVIVSLVLYPAPSAAGVTAETAGFDHIEADVPDEVMAGEEFEVTVSFFDRSGNLLPEGWKPATTLSLTISKAGSVLPSVLKPENFQPNFRFLVSTHRTGPMDMALMDKEGRVLKEWKLNVTPGRPARFVVQLPEKAVSGEKVALSFQAVDLYGNLATSYEPSQNALTIVGVAVKEAGGPAKTGAGIFEIPVIFRSAGKYSVNLKDRNMGLDGISNEIIVITPPLESFEIRDRSYEMMAGEPLAVKIRALDRFGNPVKDYSERYRGVRIFSRTAEFTPDIIPPSSFREGILTVQFNTRKAGEHDIVISEVQSNITGRFTVEVKPSQARVVKVRTQDSIRTGGFSNITLEAEDEFGNRVENLPAGCVVRLEASDGGILKPETVHVSLFKDGVAEISVAHEAAEPFEIRAVIEKKGVSGTFPGAADDGGEAKRRAERAREEAVRARRESRLNEKRVMIKQASQTRPVPERGDRHEGYIAKTETVEPVGVPGTKRDRAKRGKNLRPGIIDGVAVNESGNRGIVSFSTNGVAEYDVSTSARLSRKWINVVFPKITPDLPDHLSGGENIIGEVYVEKQENGEGVRISVEILPVRIGYELFQQGDSLILKVTRQ